MSASHDEKVRDRAYYKWLERGQPEGLDMQLWLEAEAEISAEEQGVKPLVTDPVLEKPKRKPAARKTSAKAPATKAGTAKTAAKAPTAKAATAKATTKEKAPAKSTAKAPRRPAKPPSSKPGTK